MKFSHSIYKNSNSKNYLLQTNSLAVVHSPTCISHKTCSNEENKLLLCCHSRHTKKGLEIGLKWWEQRSFERIWAPFFERFYALYEIVFQCYPCIWTYSLEGFVFLRIISKWLRYLIWMIMYPIRSSYLEMSRSNWSDSFNQYNFLKSNRTLMGLYDLRMIESL